MEYTPVQRVGPILVKRDDLFTVAGVRGGKARTCWHLAQGATGLVTAGSRSSPQVNIVAQIARQLAIPCQVHVPVGELSAEVQQAQEAGAKIVPHKPGYNSVIIARAKEAADKNAWRYIPFGMECWEAVSQTSLQVANLPDWGPQSYNRIVVPVGSGMTLCGVVHGMMQRWPGAPAPIVLGVWVGAVPFARLERYMPPPLAINVHVILRRFGVGTLGGLRVGYAQAHQLGGERAAWFAQAGIVLDEYYETKAAEYLQLGDLFWIVGIRRSADSSCIHPGAEV